MISVPTSGNEEFQAMRIYGNNNLSQLKTCLQTAHNFLLSDEEAREIFWPQATVIEQHWDTVCQKVGLNDVDRKLI
jgi:serine/threonine-protein kinase HipA